MQNQIVETERWGETEISCFNLFQMLVRFIANGNMQQRTLNNWSRRGVHIRRCNLPTQQAPWIRPWCARLPRSPILQGCPANQSCGAAPRSNPARLPREPNQAAPSCPFLQSCGSAPQVCHLYARFKTRIAPHTANGIACTRPPFRCFASSSRGISKAFPPRNAQDTSGSRRLTLSHALRLRAAVYIVTLRCL